MKLKKIKLSAFIFLQATLISSAFAENLEVKKYIKGQNYDDLITNRVITLTRSDNSEDFKLIPESSYSHIIKNSAVDKEEKNVPFTYESLYLLDKKELLDKSNSSDENIDIEDIARVCRSVSKMEGIKFPSKVKETILYKKCFTIADETSSEAIPDKNSGNADGQISYCLQDDATYGVNRYKLSYNQAKNIFLAQFSLVDIMGIGPFNAIYPGDMVINLLVIDCADDLLLFLATDLESKKYPGIKKMLTDSISERMEAVYSWFITQF